VETAGSLAAERVVLFDSASDESGAFCNLHGDSAGIVQAGAWFITGAIPKGSRVSYVFQLARDARDAGMEEYS
jgi:hypothetical protein